MQSENKTQFALLPVSPDWISVDVNEPVMLVILLAAMVLSIFTLTPFTLWALISYTFCPSSKTPHFGVKLTVPVTDGVLTVTVVL